MQETKCDTTPCAEHLESDADPSMDAIEVDKDIQTPDAHEVYRNRVTGEIKGPASPPDAEKGPSWSESGNWKCPECQILNAAESAKCGRCSYVAEQDEWLASLSPPDAWQNDLTSMPDGYYWMRIATGDHSPTIVRWEQLELSEVGVSGDVRHVIDVNEFEFLGPLPMPSPPVL